MKEQPVYRRPSVVRGLTGVDTDRWLDLYSVIGPSAVASIPASTASLDGWDLGVSGSFLPEAEAIHVPTGKASKGDDFLSLTGDTAPRISKSFDKPPPFWFLAVFIPWHLLLLFLSSGHPKSPCGGQLVTF